MRRLIKKNLQNSIYLEEYTKLTSFEKSVYTDLISKKIEGWLPCDKEAFLKQKNIDNKQAFLEIDFNKIFEQRMFFPIPKTFSFIKDYLSKTITLLIKSVLMTVTNHSYISAFGDKKKICSKLNSLTSVLFYTFKENYSTDLKTDKKILRFCGYIITNLITNNPNIIIFKEKIDEESRSKS
jgi:hypothetical protein